MSATLGTVGSKLTKCFFAIDRFTTFRLGEAPGNLFLDLFACEVFAQISCNDVMVDSLVEEFVRICRPAGLYLLFNEFLKRRIYCEIHWAPISSESVATTFSFYVGHRFMSRQAGIRIGGLDNSKGLRIGEKVANGIVKLFAGVPEYDRRGFTHFEEIQFFVDGISKDRISDFACSFMKSFLIDYTIDQCSSRGISLVDTKRWLRFGPWLDFEEYFRDYCPLDETQNPGAKSSRVKVLQFNRDNYPVVEAYVKAKERTAADCSNDPLF